MKDDIAAMIEDPGRGRPSCPSCAALRGEVERLKSEIERRGKVIYAHSGHNPQFVCLKCDPRRAVEGE